MGPPQLCPLEAKSKLSLKKDPEKISMPRTIFAHVYAGTPKDGQAGRNRRKSSKSGSGSGERNSLERECRLGGNERAVE
jgi:hypothetical protein